MEEFPMSLLSYMKKAICAVLDKRDGSYLGLVVTNSPPEGDSVAMTRLIKKHGDFVDLLVLEENLDGHSWTERKKGWRAWEEVTYAWREEDDPTRKARIKKELLSMIARTRLIKAPNPYNEPREFNPSMGPFHPPLYVDPADKPKLGRPFGS